MICARLHTEVPHYAADPSQVTHWRQEDPKQHPQWQTHTANQLPTYCLAKTRCGSPSDWSLHTALLAMQGSKGCKHCQHHSCLQCLQVMRWQPESFSMKTWQAGQAFTERVLQLGLRHFCAGAGRVPVLATVKAQLQLTDWTVSGDCLGIVIK